MNEAALNEQPGRGSASLAERTTYRDVALDAVHAAEAALETVAGGEIRVLSWLSHDMKLEVDRLCEAAIMDRIRESFPEDSILSEESGLHRGASGRTWVIDPLDGTINFSHGLPFYAISVACVACRPEVLHRAWQSSVEAAVVSVPPQKETYLATRHGGASRNGTALTLLPRPELNRALACVGMSARDGALARTLAMLGSLAGRAQKVRSLGALAGELASLAAGRLDVVVQHGTNIWDFIAAGLLVQEAGGRIEAEEFRPGRWHVVAANPALFDEVAALVEYR